MDYEKKYKEALALARSYYDKDSMNAFLDTIFPELAESEDEKIRKWLVNYFTESGENWIHREFTCKQIVAYLEKQKEQKPDDDPLDDPKFIKGFDTGREVQRIFDEKKPAEWSEEDERKYEYLHQIICNYINNPQIEYKERDKASKELIPFWERLKSLRPSWKPSEEQMEALLNAEGLVRANNYPENAKILAELYEQLKKL